MEQILVSRPDAAKALNIRVDTLDRLANAGHIKKVKSEQRPAIRIMRLSVLQTN